MEEIECVGVGVVKGFGCDFGDGFIFVGGDVFGEIVVGVVGCC